MSINHKVYRDHAGTTTEWEDIHSKHGTAGYEYVKDIKKAHREQMNVDWTSAEASNINNDGPRDRNTDSDDSSDDEDFMDDDVDSKFMEEYRQRRIAALKAQQAQRAKEKFGRVTHLTRADYVKEVTEGSEDCWVALHLYKDSSEKCRIFAEHFNELANRHPALKCMKIISTDCIENYPDALLPTILLYNEKQMKKKWVGLKEFGGTKMDANSLEWEFAQEGAVKTDLESDPMAKKLITDAMEEALKRDLLAHQIEETE
eukprot:CAMPEP_0195522686 /NCGR_PEP_ID=MMETSP0794_2-20130614/21099_1 /TAXON_ID=515487 /ORGANISM="Stephanopyxis turris, Strain CCMP 815" /LENGTH=258 /DNA_ID=CAMNT_0040652499 /DNA_START=120 /DNA_END=896 /DNA_ORIENTATION=+